MPVKRARLFALALAAVGLLATSGCGMLDFFDFGSSPSPPVRRPTERRPEPATIVPDVPLTDKLSAGDRAAIERAAARALAHGSTGEPVAWRNPATGNRGSVTPTSRAYRGHGHRPCRDYQLTVRLTAGPSQTLVGTRCRGSGGSWRRVD
jgi:surface antigen